MGLKESLTLGLKTVRIQFKYMGPFQLTISKVTGLSVRIIFLGAAFKAKRKI